MDFNQIQQQLLPPPGSIFPYSSVQIQNENDFFVKQDVGGVQGHLPEEFSENQQLPTSLYPSGVSPITSGSDSNTSGNANQPTRKKPKRRRIITPEQRTAANVRERKRMFSMNDGFDELRKHLPKFSYENKLSRIETLRLAIIYIQYMTDIVKNNKTPTEATVRSLKHGWPSSKPRYHFPPFLPAHLYPMISANCDMDYFGQGMPVFPIEMAGQSPTHAMQTLTSYHNEYMELAQNQNSENYW